MGCSVRHALSLRWCGLALGVAVAALALPVQASASGQASACCVQQIDLSTGTAMKVAGLKLSLFANTKGPDVAPDTGASLSNKTESDLYDFFSGVTYTAKSDLSSARVSATFLLNRGSINMKFHATGPVTKIPVPKGCKGVPGKKRKGVLKGSFHIKADRLGKLSVSSVGATLSIPANYSCALYPFHGVVVEANSTNSKNAVSVDAWRATKGGVSESIAVRRFGPNGGGSIFVHEISVDGLSDSHYTHASNLSSAKVTGGGPLHGAANYAGSPVVNDNSNGTLGGTLTAHFATIGTFKLSAHSPLPADQENRS